jgi:hypothetical protein
MNKVLLFYLTANDRYFYFDEFIKELIKCENINNIELLIINSFNDMTYYKNILKNYTLNYNFAYVPCPKHNYLPKIKYAIEYAKNNNINYIFKCDNDMIITYYTIDFILSNINKLDNEFLTLQPCISTGIPTVEYFIDDLFNKTEQKMIYNEFLKCKFNNQIGVYDYRVLNSGLNDNYWDKDSFYNMTSIMNTYYKGIHPIRYGFGNDILNELIVLNKNKIFEKKQCNIITEKNNYIANMCFFISTKNYDNLINTENFTINGCDDVQIYRYSKKYNIQHGIISRGYAIHLSYGWRWTLNENQKNDDYININCPTNTLLEYEIINFNKLYNKTI